MSLERNYTTAEVAEALRLSTKWVRDRVREGAEHQRYGRRIMFTAEQVEKLRAEHTQQPVQQSITTGRKRRAS